MRQVSLWLAESHQRVNVSLAQICLVANWGDKNELVIPLSFVHTKRLTIRFDCVSVLQVKANKKRKHLPRLATQGSLAYFLF